MSDVLPVSMSRSMPTVVMLAVSKIFPEVPNEVELFLVYLDLYYLPLDLLFDRARDQRLANLGYHAIHAGFKLRVFLVVLLLLDADAFISHKLLVLALSCFLFFKDFRLVDVLNVGYFSHENFDVGFDLSQQVH